MQYSLCKSMDQEAGVPTGRACGTPLLGQQVLFASWCLLRSGSSIVDWEKGSVSRLNAGAG
jgi:hypothetical protein